MADHTAGIDSPPDRARVARLTAEATRRIESALRSHERPMVAWSGGKDGTVVLDIASKINPLVSVYCDTAFMYERANLDTETVARQRSWRVTFDESRSWEWLARNRNLVFTEDNGLRAKFFAQRHQRGIRLHAQAMNADLVLFGRRHQENSIRSILHTKDGRTHAHPIAEWRTEDVWHYLRLNGFSIPWLYTTHHGQWIGYNPFTSVRPSTIGAATEAECWRYVAEHDPKITPDRLASAATS